MKVAKTYVIYSRHGVRGFADKQHYDRVLETAIKEDEGLPIAEKTRTFMFARAESLSEALELCSHDEKKLLKLFNEALALKQMQIAKVLLESDYQPGVVDLAEPLTTALED